MPSDPALVEMELAVCSIPTPAPKCSSSSFARDLFGFVPRILVFVSIAQEQRWHPEVRRQPTDQQDARQDDRRHDPSVSRVQGGQWKGVLVRTLFQLFCKDLRASTTFQRRRLRVHVHFPLRTSPCWIRGVSSSRFLGLGPSLDPFLALVRDEGGAHLPCCAVESSAWTDPVPSPTSRYLSPRDIDAFPPRTRAHRDLALGGCDYPKKISMGEGVKNTGDGLRRPERAIATMMAIGSALAMACFLIATGANAIEEASTVRVNERGDARVDSKEADGR
eukprot:scaffold64_cov338-Pavlova_lutheri.AAC.37